MFADLVKYFPGYQYASQAQTYAIAMGASSSGDSADMPEADVQDLSGINATSPDQTSGNNTQQNGDGTWDDSDVAWTDPNTGIKYDVDGNELPGQR